MASLAAWIQAIDEEAVALARQLQGELARLNVALPPRPTTENATVGIIVASAPSELLLSMVSAGSDRGRMLVISARACDGLVWPLLQAGASDVLVAEAEAATSSLAASVAARLERWQTIDELAASPAVASTCTGQSRPWLGVLRQVVEAARFTEAAVLVTGESGTGKELVARLIHQLDPRRHKGELVIVDCTTVVETLAGSEFFGHVKGAFTGASAERIGAFALADGGTLFLDEVGELPGALQAELLRVVQEKTYKPVGSNAWKKTDFRLVCATNRDLRAEEAAGRFRRDLYHRLAGWTCRLPPLRERPQDILPLARRFIASHCGHAAPPELTPPVEEFLVTQPFPGNVRELKHLVSRMMLRYSGAGPLTPGCLPDDQRPAGGVKLDWEDQFHVAVRRAVARRVSLKEIGRLAESAAVACALDEADGNVQQAARTLGVTDRALQMRIAAQRRTIDGNGALREP
ncbi:MAG: sigma 54-interacting transcriptional regulator [Planctomycetaceae bacterium]|nr:sigma 54-interacting transcriptional regulator [Planctomycetaceae bacterium]